MFDLSNRVAVVTGGESGIGRSCAALLRRQGAQCVVWDVAGSPDIQCDVSEEAQVEAAIQGTIKRFGSPSLLVAAAGLGGWPGTIVETEMSQWDRTFAVNLRGVVLSMRAVARAMIDARSDGAIVLIGSINGVQAFSGTAAYSASKAGVFHLARIAARELGPHGIRVNAIGPGYTATPMAEPLLQMPDLCAEVIENTPLRRVGTPEDVAEAAVGVMKMSWVTGQGFMADGGFGLSTWRDWYPSLKAGTASSSKGET